MQPSSARHLFPYLASGGPSRPLTVSPTHPACFCVQESTDIVVLLPCSHLRGIPREGMWYSRMQVSHFLMGLAQLLEAISLSHHYGEAAGESSWESLEFWIHGRTGAVPGTVNMWTCTNRWQTSYEKLWMHKCSKMEARRGWEELEKSTCLTPSVARVMVFSRNQWNSWIPDVLKETWHWGWGNWRTPDTVIFWGLALSVWFQGVCLFKSLLLEIHTPTAPFLIKQNPIM